ncbi:bile acid:sodium symporter [Bradyrhizobium sp. F1.4.3]|uniref:bile acid:sodium symporter n=1 Tax=Bradyrhizobium sp. F1.4.3 TaxID=3156356 RepID=UPI00339440A9
MSRPKFLPENFTLALIATVVAASELPCRGTAALVVDHLTDLAIALLFFLHGAKLSREAVIAAASHWRLHALVLLTTFVLFPLFGLAFRPILSPLATPTLYAGILFLCTLPSTVQSSIAFTAIAKGNVPAAICSASASSIIGIFVTPGHHHGASQFRGRPTRPDGAGRGHQEGDRAAEDRLHRPMMVRAGERDTLVIPAEAPLGGEKRWQMVRDRNDLQFFVAVVVNRGFSAASRVLGVPKSRVSRRIALLEERLGVRLLDRTTRGLGLTNPRP